MTLENRIAKLECILKNEATYTDSFGNVVRTSAYNVFLSDATKVADDLFELVEELESKGIDTHEVSALIKEFRRFRAKAESVIDNLIG